MASQVVAPAWLAAPGCYCCNEQCFTVADHAVGAMGLIGFIFRCELHVQYHAWSSAGWLVLWQAHHHTPSRNWHTAQGSWPAGFTAGPVLTASHIRGHSRVEGSLLARPVLTARWLLGLWDRISTGGNRPGVGNSGETPGRSYHRIPGLSHYRFKAQDSSIGVADFIIMTRPVQWTLDMRCIGSRPVLS